MSKATEDRSQPLMKRGICFGVRNPFEESGADRAGLPISVIVSIEAPGPQSPDVAQHLQHRGANVGRRRVRLTFASALFGYLDETNGHFVGVGMD